MLLGVAGKRRLENQTGTPGGVDFGVGICPVRSMVSNFTPMTGYRSSGHDNYGNYQYQEGSIMVWIPKFYYRIAHAGNPTYGTYGVNSIDVKGSDTYISEVDANTDGYALHRAFIDGGFTKDGFFIDKYMTSKNARGTGQIASSIKNGDPISTLVDHNPIADLTACDSNAIFEAINAAHARDGVNGAVNASSLFHVTSRLQYSALAILAMAHAQASSDTTFCAWYDATYNYPKGCNDNALQDYDETMNGAGTGDDLLYTSDGYSNCGKTGSGVPFAKSTHNGQNCGVADLNGLMYEISLGVTFIATIDTIEDISRTYPAVVTETGHTKSTGDYVSIIDTVGGSWFQLSRKIYTVTRINADTYSLDGVSTSGFSTAYVQDTNHGTTIKGTFYAAKEATSMKDFTSGNVGATDHWGATGVAAMMDAFVPALATDHYANDFEQIYGKGGNQVLAEDLSGANWLLTGLAFPKDKYGISVFFSGTFLFGEDFFYQYLQDELCLVSCAGWFNGDVAGVWTVFFDDDRVATYRATGFRCALSP